MALSPEDLNRINGFEADAALAAARKRNAARHVGSVAERLAGVANEAGVIDPADSLRVHTSEVPVVGAETPVDPFAEENTPMEELTIEQLTGALEDRQDRRIKVTDESSPVTIKVTHN